MQQLRMTQRHTEYCSVCEYSELLIGSERKVGMYPCVCPRCLFKAAALVTGLPRRELEQKLAEAIGTFKRRR